jgi:hypothetical protein
MGDAIGVSELEVHRFGDDVLIEGYLNGPDIGDAAKPADG